MMLLLHYFSSMCCCAPKQKDYVQDIGLVPCPCSLDMAKVALNMLQSLLLSIFYSFCSHIHVVLCYHFLHLVFTDAPFLRYSFVSFLKYFNLLRDLSSSYLHGAFPSVIGDMAELKELYVLLISHNRELVFIKLYYNSILNHIETFTCRDVQSNYFHGSIPDSFAALSKLSKLYAYNFVIP